MEGYILIVLQILITGLIIWRRKQDSKEPSGCLAAGVIFMIVFALTTALFSLGHLIINEGLFANIFAESRGSLAAASPMEWLMAGFICLIMSWYLPPFALWLAMLSQAVTPNSAN